MEKHKHKDVVINKIGGELVVTSRQVAEDFEKNHADVVTKIEGKVRPKGKSEIGLIQGIVDSGEIPKNYFIEDSYLDSYGRKQKEYLLTKDGFSLLVMGFTGAKALQWKLKYIEAFNKMEEHIKGQARPLSTEETLELQFKFTKEVKKEVKELKEDFNSFKEDLPLIGDEPDELVAIVKSKGTQVLGGKDSLAYKNKSLSKKIYSNIWKYVKEQFNVKKYKAIKRKYLEKAKEIVQAYEPPFYLKEEITRINNQINFKDVV